VEANCIHYRFAPFLADEPNGSGGNALTAERNGVTAAHYEHPAYSSSAEMNLCGVLILETMFCVRGRGR
jgi:hypothetical protein